MLKFSKSKHVIFSTIHTPCNWVCSCMQLMMQWLSLKEDWAQNRQCISLQFRMDAAAYWDVELVCSFIELGHTISHLCCKLHSYDLIWLSVVKLSMNFMGNFLVYETLCLHLLSQLLCLQGASVMEKSWRLLWPTEKCCLMLVLMYSIYFLQKATLMNSGCSIEVILLLRLIGLLAILTTEDFLIFVYFIPWNLVA